MSAISPIERETQNRIIALFVKIGYEYYGNWETRANNVNVEEEYLRKFLLKQGYSETIIKKVINETNLLAHTNAGNLYDRNRNFYSFLRYGANVKESEKDQKQTAHLIDWKNPDNNYFGIAEEVTLSGNLIRRPDLVLYINGIAVGVIELKRGIVDIAESVRQNISNQRDKFNEKFYTTVQMIFAGNDTQGLKYGTIGTTEKYYLSWKEDEQDNSGYKLDKYLNKLCDRERVLDVIYNTVVYDGGIKKLPRHHQYFALKEAQKFVKNQEGGIIWHTQGSGKSIMMVILAQWILENISNSRVVLITDRTELDGQIKGVFEDTGFSSISQANSGNELLEYLQDNKPRLICSLIHKFGNKTDLQHKEFIKYLQENPIKTQGNIFVFVDECHRTQSKTLNETMKTVLHNAVFIGFTGTPLLKEDKKTTMEVFGRYIHTYKFNEAVEDGVVKDLVYEGRDIEQKLSSPDKVDAWFDAKTKGLNDFQKSELKKKWGTMQNVLSSKSRMSRIVTDILYDFSVKPRLSSEKGNAILVAGSIYEACKYYNLFQQTELKGKCAVITSYNPYVGDITTEDTGEETETDREYIYNTYEELLKNVDASPNKTKTETYEDRCKDQFRKQPAKMKLLIVVSKLLTGFDAPPCTYIYIDKRMQDHTLFQAICRVNRLDTDDKDFGYIVDYMELFGKVEDAINVYTSELDSEHFSKEEVEINIQDRLKLAKERIENALEMVEAVIEPVALPKSQLEYIQYFCGNTELEDDLKANEFKRVSLYKAIVAYIRAYANISADFVEAGYSENQINNFEIKLDEYLKIREVIKFASGEYLDLKAYEADMRHLIDHYIQAEESEKITPFDDVPLLTLLELNFEKAVEDINDFVGGSKDSVAEIIENNVRSKLVEKHLLDPIYYENISKLFLELIEERLRRSIAYNEYLKRMAEIVKMVNQGKSEDTPKEINTGGQKALYHYLNDVKLALDVDDAVQKAKMDGFRENKAKQQAIKNAIFQIVGDVDKTIELYIIIENNKQDY